MHCTARNPTLRHSTATPRPSVSEAASDNDVLGLSGIKSTSDFNQNQSLTCMLYCTLCYTLFYIPVFLGISPLMGPGCCLGLCKFPCEAACAMGFFFFFCPQDACPKNASYYGNRAATLMMLSRFREALEDSQQAVRLDECFMKVSFQPTGT